MIQPQDPASSGIEREYKYTTNLDPKELESHLLFLGYDWADLLHIYTDETTRVGRRQGPNGQDRRYRRCYKSPPTYAPGEPATRHEAEEDMSDVEFGLYAADALAGEYPYLLKRRYDVPADGGLWEVDIYRAPVPGLIVIEFETAGIPPTAPSLFGKLRRVDEVPQFYAANIAGLTRPPGTAHKLEAKLLARKQEHKALQKAHGRLKGQCAKQQSTLTLKDQIIKVREHELSQARKGSSSQV